MHRSITALCCLSFFLQDSLLDKYILHFNIIYPEKGLIYLFFPLSNS